MKRIRFVFSLSLAVVVTLLAGGPIMDLRADDADFGDAPANLDGGLRALTMWHRAQASVSPTASSSNSGAQTHAVQQRAELRRHLQKFHGGRLQFDGESRVVVDVLLDGTAPTAVVRAALEGLGARVFSRYTPTPGTSANAAPFPILSTLLPTERAAEAAQIQGVQSISLVHRPTRHIGSITSEGVGVLRSDTANDSGFTGKGITIGVISDSFNVGFLITTLVSAQADVATGDLPGAGNRLGHTQPVIVYRDGSAANGYDTDEGRAMLQIIHDVAPDSTLAFASAGDTIFFPGFADFTTFAATPSTFRDAVFGLAGVFGLSNFPDDEEAGALPPPNRPSVRADVIVDDIGFLEEPFFSDGIGSQAIDDVTNAEKAEHQVLYFSAAGNEGGRGYDGEFSLVSDADVRSGAVSAGNLKFTNVPAALTAGGFHNFAAAAGQPGVNLVQRLTVSGDSAILDLQWDDPFYDVRKITTDYNLLVFNADGEYLGDIVRFNQSIIKPQFGLVTTGPTSNSFKTALPVEIVELDLGSDRSQPAIYQIAIARRAEGAKTATHLRYLIFGDLSVVGGDYLRNDLPTTFGHATARNCIGVGAYAASRLSAPESFTSRGPVTILFDRAGNRLPEPEVRAKPEISAPDGVSTTFFGFDSDSDGIPNFFGTSAAAPHAAGVAALLLQAAGGPSTLSVERTRSLLQSSASSRERDIDPFASSAEINLPNGNGSVSLTAKGSDDATAGTAADFFILRYDVGPAGASVASVTINLSPAGLKFDTNSFTGFPFTISSAVGVNPKSVTATVKTPAGANSAADSQVVLAFPANAFKPGASLSFGIGRSAASNGDRVNSADRLASATVVVQVQPKTGAKVSASGALSNQIGTGYNPVDGFGLIDAQRALELLEADLAHPTFFIGEVALSNGVYYLRFPANGNIFGYYAYLEDPRFIYHFDLGYEYLVPSNDGANGLYLYDFQSGSWFYTSSSFPFPYLYDFSLNATLYWFPDIYDSQRYTSHPRYFYNFATGQVITK